MGRLISVDDLTAEERIELMATLWDGLDRALAAPITPAFAAELATGTWSGRVRRVLLRRFPYGICCKVYPSTSSIVGVVRGRRHPDTWLGRAAR